MFFLPARALSARGRRLRIHLRSTCLIKLENVTLRIKQIRGSRYGDFCVGDLYHETCELKIKDSLLEQFEEGEYHGTVWISRIFLHQYIAYGKAVTEIRGTLHDLQLDSATTGPLESELPEPDPILEFPAPVSGPGQSAVQQSADSVPTENVKTDAETPMWKTRLRERIAKVGSRRSASPAQDGPAVAPVEKPNSDPPDVSLPAVLEEYWALILSRKPVKLDATVDRARLREQLAEMNKLDYKFAFKEQTWIPE